MSRPVDKVFKYGVEVALWESDGKRSFSIRKTYKDKNTGKYKETKKYFESDIINLRNCLNEIIERHNVRPYEKANSDNVNDDVGF